MINFRLLVTPSFWFTTAWNPLTHRTVWLMAIVFGLLIVAGVAVIVLAGRRESSDSLAARYLRRFSGPLFFGGIVGEYLTFVAYEQVPLLSARFWFLALFLVCAVWAGVLVRQYVRDVPRIRATSEKRAQFESYLPKKKRK